MTIAITGEVDHHRAKDLAQEMEQKLELYCPGTLTLDLSGVTFMDSSGIAVLLRAYRRMRELEGSFSVIGVPRQAGRVLRAAGLHKLMPIMDGEE